MIPCGIFCIHCDCGRYGGSCRFRKIIRPRRKHADYMLVIAYAYIRKYENESNTRKQQRADSRSC